MIDIPENISQKTYDMVLAHKRHIMKLKPALYDRIVSLDFGIFRERILAAVNFTCFLTVSEKD